MKDEMLYYAIQTSSVLPLIILFISVWIIERNRVLGEWILGLVLNSLTIIIKMIGMPQGGFIQLLYNLLYASGMIFILIGSFHIGLTKEWEEKSITWMEYIYSYKLNIIIFCMAMVFKHMNLAYLYYALLSVVVGISILYYRRQRGKVFLAIGFMARGVCLIILRSYAQYSKYRLFIEVASTTINLILSVGIILSYYTLVRSKAAKSFEELDQIMINIPGIICKIDCKGNILYCNDGIENLLGYKEKWTELDKFSTIVHEKDKRQIPQVLSSLRPERHNAKFQIRLNHQRGYFIWASIEITAIIDTNKNKIANIIYCKDMTTEKITYSDLMKSQRKFYQLFQGIQDAIFIEPFSKDYVHSHFMQFNKAAYNTYGYKEFECRRLCLAQLDLRFVENTFSKDGKSNEEIMETLLGEQKVTYETEYIAKGGQIIPVEVTDHMFKLNNEQVIMTVVRDISERNIIKQAIELEKLKSDFLANVSHELRTPLNVIITTLQVLEIRLEEAFENAKKENEKIWKYTEIMKQNTLRLLKLVNNFVCMAKIESGFYEMNKQHYNIVTLVEDISHSVITYVEANGIHFEFDTDIEEKIVDCDFDMMEKIILNLISNAVKFTEKGGTLRIYIHDLDQRVQIRVQDSGIGIPKEKQKIIFERFRQADKTFTRKQEGCGIGLSLVKHFIKMHEGTIEVESEEEIGTTFIVELPALENHDYIENYNEDYNLVEKGDTLYRRALEFSDIYKRVD